MTVRDFINWIMSLPPEERQAYIKSCDHYVDPFVDPSEEFEDSEDEWGHPSARAAPSK